jgi:hypothetical protein
MVTKLLNKVHVYNLTVDNDYSRIEQSINAYETFTTQAERIDSETLISIRKKKEERKNEKLRQTMKFH